MLDPNEEPLIRNYRNVQPLRSRRLFHICPSTSKYSTLLPIPKEERIFSYNSKNTRPLQSDPKQKQEQQEQQVFRAEIRTRDPFNSDHQRQRRDSYCMDPSESFSSRQFSRREEYDDRKTRNRRSKDEYEYMERSERSDVGDRARYSSERHDEDDRMPQKSSRIKSVKQRYYKN